MLQCSSSKHRGVSSLFIILLRFVHEWKYIAFARCVNTEVYREPSEIGNQPIKCTRWLMPVKSRRTSTHAPKQRGTKRAPIPPATVLPQKQSCRNPRSPAPSSSGHGYTGLWSRCPIGTAMPRVTGSSAWGEAIPSSPPRRTSHHWRLGDGYRDLCWWCMIAEPMILSQRNPRKSCLRSSVFQHRSNTTVSSASDELFRFAQLLLHPGKYNSDILQASLAHQLLPAAQQTKPEEVCSPNPPIYTNEAKNI